MDADEVHRILHATYTFWVEILHPEASDWVQIHQPDWETTDSYGDAMEYAVQVRKDHPGSRVRIVETSPDLPTVYIRVQ